MKTSATASCNPQCAEFYAQGKPLN